MSFDMPVTDRNGEEGTSVDPQVSHVALVKEAGRSERDTQVPTHGRTSMFIDHDHRAVLKSILPSLQTSAFEH